MPDGGLPFEGDIKTADDVLRTVKGVQEYLKTADGKLSELDKLVGLEKAIKDLENAARSQAALDAARVAASPVNATERELVSLYKIRENDFDSDNRPRTLSLNGKAVKEEPGSVRLFSHHLARGEDSTGQAVEFDVLPGFLDDPDPKSEAQRKLQEVWSVRNIVRAQRRARGHSGITPHLDARVARALAACPVDVQRAFVDGTNVGAEWIPDDYVPVLETYIKGARFGASGLVPELAVGRDTTILPYLTSGYVPYVRAKASGDDPAQYRASSLATDSRSITVKTLAVRAQVDDEASEDAYAFLASQIFAEAAYALASAEEDAMINGDTTATHQDAIASWTAGGEWAASPGGGSDDHRRLVIGLRARAADISNTVDRSTTSFATFMADRASLAGPKAGPMDTVCVAGGYVLAAILGTITEVKTRDVYGPQATVVTGELMRLGGTPLIESAFMTRDLASSGLYTGSGATGGYVILRPSRFRHVTRRAPRYETQRDVTRGIRHDVWTMRGLPLFCLGSATEMNVRYAYNM